MQKEGKTVGLSTSPVLLRNQLAITAAAKKETEEPSERPDRTTGGKKNWNREKSVESGIQA